MNSIEKPCRLEVFLATQAPIAVILRQGPHLWVEMIEWNTRRDTFDYGQWFKGRVDERKSDLSPDGKRFIYFATKYNKHTTDYKAGGFYAWTALSQPPRFTAVALWPHGSTYDGGGTFEDNNTLFMHYPYSPHPDEKRFFSWPPRTELVKRLLADKCEYCGASGQTEKIQVHHIRALKDLEKYPGREKPGWVKVMAARRRKTLVLCQSCHQDVTYGRPLRRRPMSASG